VRTVLSLIVKSAAWSENCDSEKPLLDCSKTCLYQMAPQRPSNLHPLTEELLDRLKEHPEASEIVIGGGVALSHYSEHRNTFDLDAWWK
jgi:hypothetical protein